MARVGLPTWHRKAVRAALLAWLLSAVFLVVLGASPHANAVTVLQVHGALQRDGEVGIISHRGAAALAPENTLSAVRVAVEQQVDFIEVDLRATSDGHAILMHDETLERTTNGRGTVANHTLDEIRQLDAGRWFHDTFRGERVPTLEELVSEIAPTPTRAFIELKADWTLDELHAVIDTLRGYQLINRVVLLSFAPETLDHLAQIAPEFARVLLTRDLGPESLERAMRLQVSGIGAREVLLADEPAVVEWAQSLGIGIVAYTLNSEATWEFAKQLGVDLIVTDDPKALEAWRAQID